MPLQFNQCSPSLSRSRSLQSGELRAKFRATLPDTASHLVCTHCKEQDFWVKIIVLGKAKSVSMQPGQFKATIAPLYTSLVDGKNFDMPDGFPKFQIFKGSDNSSEIGVQVRIEI